MSDRRKFLTHLGAGAAALTVSSMVSPARVTAEAMSANRDAESHGSANSLSARDLATACGAEYMAEDWDLSWTSRLTGKHRAVFDTPEVEHGVGVLRSGLWLRQYGDVLKAPPSELNSVLVLRHHAIILAMSQPFWDEYELGEKNKVMDPITDKKTTRNPALLSTETGAPPSYAAMALDKQLANGTIALGCGLAFAQMVGLVREKHKLDAADANIRAREGLVPGVILQPSGFFATTLAGENGCIYVRAS